MTEEVLTLNNSTVELDASTRIGIHDLCSAHRKEPDLTPLRLHTVITDLTLIQACFCGIATK